MGAFSRAFDIVVVGALALSWVLLVLHLFFSDNESSLKKLLDWVKEQQQPALAGVLLFAMAFPLGSGVSRIAQDFFDDDDLHIPVFHYLLRVGVTESSIRTDVFCKTFNPDQAASTSSNPPTENPEQLKVNDPKSEEEFAKNCTPSNAADSRSPDSSVKKREPAKTMDSKRSDPLRAKGEQFRSTDPDCTYTGRWVIQPCDLKTRQY